MEKGNQKEKGKKKNINKIIKTCKTLNKKINKKHQNINLVISDTVNVKLNHEYVNGDDNEKSIEVFNVLANKIMEDYPVETSSPSQSDDSGEDYEDDYEYNYEDFEFDDDRPPHQDDTEITTQVSNN